MRIDLNHLYSCIINETFKLRRIYEQMPLSGFRQASFKGSDYYGKNVLGEIQIVNHLINIV